MKLECHLAQIVKWPLRPRSDCTRLLRPRRVLSEGRDFDDFGGIFPPPNAFAANSANARVLCAETTFPRLSPRAMTAKANPLPMR